MADLLKHSFDEFSEDRRYRFVMGHIWDDAAAALVSCALNPSVGDSERNDATNERLERRAIRMGLGGVIFVNLFPIVAKDPADMKRASDPFGDRERADSVILEYAVGNYLLCGWGNHGRHLGRDVEVKALLRNAGLTLYALSLNNTGQPKHPLYIHNDTEPFLWSDYAPVPESKKNG